nr:MAG TPA: hypothetical protein [Caudoviricetes sp.]
MSPCQQLFYIFSHFFKKTDVLFLNLDCIQF